jgi:hypothetical protein
MGDIITFSQQDIQDSEGGSVSEVKTGDTNPRNTQWIGMEAWDD